MLYLPHQKQIIDYLVTYLLTDQKNLFYITRSSLICKEHFFSINLNSFIKYLVKIVINVFRAKREMIYQMNNVNLHSYAVTTAPFTVKIRAEKMQQLMGK